MTSTLPIFFTIPSELPQDYCVFVVCISDLAVKVSIAFKSLELETAKTIGFGSFMAQQIAPVVVIPSVSEVYTNAFADNLPIELVAGDSVTQQDLVIRAAYKQVFGNTHLMESEKSPQAESQLRSGQITVLEFIRQLAKSERYRALFLENCTNLRAIELNFKHLLGRSPENSAEISQHIQILAEKGFEAEIDSYFDSDEYTQNFGTKYSSLLSRISNPNRQGTYRIYSFFSIVTRCI